MSDLAALEALGIVVPLVLAIVAAARQAGLPSRWTPLSALGIGAAVAFVGSLAGVVAVAAPAAAFAGALAGAAAVGLHQTGRKLNE